VGIGDENTPVKIVSGGQTCVDRAALDAARAAGRPGGGWCPRGRRAEDGRIPDEYPLADTPLRAYPQRTEWNVRDSDATLILHLGRLRGGSALTARVARRLGRPCLCVDLAQPTLPAVAAGWVREHGARVLNVAGPRESDSPGIHDAALAWLAALLDALADGAAC
jgi:Circularly permutated YpsA SLOG family